jgi:regulatory protein SWI6
VDALHASLRMTSVQLSETRRTLEATQAKVKEQSLARQKVQSLTRARDEENYRMMQLQQAHGAQEDDVATWQAELEGHLVNGQPSSSPVSALPSAAVLRARINAVRNRSNEMHRAIGGLKSRSREVELKYRHLVALCTRRPEMEVDALLDGLLRAVESEKGDLEIGRVRRFLGGVDGSAQ